MVRRCSVQAPRRWDRSSSGWSPELRDELLTQTTAITARDVWRRLALEDLESEDSLTFYQAAEVAQVLGIDTYDWHWRRLTSDPARGNWYHVMKLANEQRIDDIVAFAEKSCLSRRSVGGQAMNSDWDSSGPLTDPSTSFFRIWAAFQGRDGR